MARVVEAASFLLVMCVVLATSQEEEYLGKFLGKLNSYHHQVAGRVYAVNETTFLFKKFTYDGTGADTFFWAGGTVRAGPQGFIVPNEKGRTNVLKLYLNKDFTLTLPDKKKITDIKWISIYDLNFQENFGDVSIEEGFEPPATQILSEISQRAHNVSSAPIEVIDSKTIRIPDFTYDGLGSNTYFYVGIGPQPTAKGNRIPDEKGYVTKLRAYAEETITLRLPGEMTVFEIDWLSVLDGETGQNFGSVLIPDNLNVPPSLLKVLKHESSLPNCESLHRDIQFSWEVFGPAITIEIAARIDVDEYVAFGLSGSETDSRMEGSDVAILYLDNALQGYAIDYNITAKSTCVKVLESAYRGVCPDEKLGGTNNYQLMSYKRENGLTVITTRRSLVPPETGDQAFPQEGLASLVWAVGKMDKAKRPTYHRLWPRQGTFIKLGRPAERNCRPFLDVEPDKREPWGPFKILEPSTRVFSLRLGPSGGARGYEGITGKAGSDLAWYVNGFLAPEIYLKRELTYNFQVEGGSDSHSPNYYHPLIITDDERGGYEQMDEKERSGVRVFAGVKVTRRGQPQPIAAGRLCLWRHGDKDARLDSDFESFQKFRNSLKLFCEEGGQPANLELKPDNSWPDVVYYHSYTHPGMGWKINIVDRFDSLVPAGLFGFALSGVCATTCSISIPWYLLTVTLVTLLTKY